jgi:hypothetical protein
MIDKRLGAAWIVAGAAVTAAILNSAEDMIDRYVLPEGIAWNLALAVVLLAGVLTVGVLVRRDLRRLQLKVLNKLVNAEDPPSRPNLSPVDH